MSTFAQNEEFESESTVWWQDRLTPFWGLKALVRLVGMRTILEELEFPLLSARRATCQFCDTGVICFDDRRWSCGSCGRSGGAFSLVARIKECKSSVAVAFVASLAARSIQTFFRDARHKAGTASTRDELATVHRKTRDECYKRYRRLIQLQTRVTIRRSKLACGHEPLCEGEFIILGGLRDAILIQIPAFAAGCGMPNPLDQKCVEQVTQVANRILSAI